MSRTVRRIACSVLFALTLVTSSANVFAQSSYTWRNVQIYVDYAELSPSYIVRAANGECEQVYGFKSGTFYVSTDGGKTFAATAATGLPLSGPVRFKAVPGREGDIWLAGGAETDNAYGLWHSTNSGASFTKLANVEEADNIGFGKAATGQTYLALYAVAQVAGLRGIFRSIDAGQTWVRINDDQHQWGRAGDTAITGDPRIFGRVYFGTNGRGIIYGDGN